MLESKQACTPYDALAPWWSCNVSWGLTEGYRNGDHRHPVAPHGLVELHFLLLFIRSGQKCSGPRSVTAIICSGRNETKPDTRYSHSLDCSWVSYRSQNATHIHLTLDDINLHITYPSGPSDIRTNRDVNQLFAVWSFRLLYMQYSWCEINKRSAICFV